MPITKISPPADMTDLVFPPITAALLAQAAAENSVALAQAAADLAASVGAGDAPNLPSRTTAIASTFPATRTYVVLNGYAAVGDAPPAVYVRVTSQPSHQGKFRSVDRFLPNGTTDATNGGWWELAENAPCLQQYGGSDDGVTYNDAALAAAKSQLSATAGRLRLPLLSAGIYAFDPAGAGVDISDIVVDADPGVVVNGPVQFVATTQTASDVVVHYQDGSGFVFNGFKFSSEHLRPVERKEAWLTGGDLERKVVSGYDMTTLGSVYTDFATGDSWTFDSSVSSSADTISVNLANDGILRAGTFIAVRGGDEVGVSFWPGSYVRAAVVRFAGGWMAFYANNSNGILRTKLLGVAASDSSALSWFGLGTNPAWSPDRADWRIRIYDSRTFSILLNGQEIIEQQQVSGPIVDAGFGMVGLSSLTASMSYISKIRRSEAAGRSAARILVVGDSTSADIAGGWPYYTREELEGSFGMRVWDVFNQAVAGHTSTQQLTALNANDAQLTQSTHMVVHVGINDDQSSGAATTLSNISAMIDRAVSRGIGPRRIVICVPYLWYTKTLAGGSVGFDAGPNDAHWLLRAGIRRLAGVKGCRLVDLSEVMVQVQPADIAVTGRDPQVRDNIHPTLFSYRKIGHAVAREIMAGTAYEMTQREALTSFDASWLLNGWTSDATFPAKYSVSADGVVNLSGLLNKGTVSEPVIIARLPRNMCPSMTLEFACRTNTGSVTVIYVGTDGAITLSAFPATVTVSVSLANISFQLPPF